MKVVNPGAVSMLRWLRRQLSQPGPAREHIEAAIANDDPAEVRRLLAAMDFSEDQRRNVEQMLAAWEARRGEPDPR